MSFTRSASGIANYVKFCNADLLIVTEGGQAAEGEGAIVPDEAFYTALFKGLIPNVRVKVKCVGNRETAFTYVELIDRNKISNTIVAVDRDSFGISCSIVDSPRLLYTYGYSWENDLWDLVLAKSILGQLTFANADAGILLQTAWANGSRRLKFLSALDLACQVSSACSLFPKNGRSCGIQFDNSDLAPIPFKEKRRLIEKYRNSPANGCSISHHIFASASKKPKDQVIQGHLWESFVMHLISWIAKKKCGLTKPCNTLLRNLAFDYFSANVRDCLGDSKYNYYVTALRTKIPEYLAAA